MEFLFLGYNDSARFTHFCCCCYSQFWIPLFFMQLHLYVTSSPCTFVLCKSSFHWYPIFSFFICGRTVKCDFVVKFFYFNLLVFVLINFFIIYLFYNFSSLLMFFFHSNFCLRYFNFQFITFFANTHIHTYTF